MSQNSLTPSFQPYQPSLPYPRLQSLASSSHAQQVAQGGKDILRDSPLRYWGYVNEVAESGKDLLKWGVGDKTANKLVNRSYGVVKGYVGVDALHKAAKGYKKAEQEGYSHAGRMFASVEQGVEAGLFQAGASLYGPAFVISTFRDVAKMALYQLSGDKRGFKSVVDEVEAAIRDPKKSKLEKAPEHIKKWLFKPLGKLPPLLKGKMNVQRASRLAQGVPMIGSIALIPLLIHPIDSAVHKVLDMSYRPMMRHIKGTMFGASAPKQSVQTQAFMPITPFQPARMNQPFYQPTTYYPQYQRMG